MSATIGRLRPGTVLLVLALLPAPVGAGARRDPPSTESNGDSAFAHRQYEAAIRRYELQLERSDLSPSDRDRLAQKTARARRALHEAVLAARRKALNAGRPEEALRYAGFPDPDLRAEDLNLVRQSAEALIARGSTELVYRFLDGFEPRDADCASVRACIWTALAAAYKPVPGPGLLPRDYARAIDRAESLAAYAPANRVVRESLAGLRPRAAAFHLARAAELSGHPGASFIHRQLAIRYGATEDHAGWQADREIERLTRAGWRLTFSTPLEERCLDWRRHLDGLLGRGEGQRVEVSVALEQCGPGRHSWESPRGESVLVVDQASSRTIPGATRRSRPAVIWGAPSRSVRGKSSVRWVHPVEEAETFLVRGTAIVTCEWNREIVALDVHPRPARRDSREDHLYAAARETAGAIRDAWRRIASGRADDLLQQAAIQERIRNHDEAEAGYAMAILLQGSVPEAAGNYFDERYGLGNADLIRCLPPDPAP